MHNIEQDTAIVWWRPDKIYSRGTTIYDASESEFTTYINQSEFFSELAVI